MATILREEIRTDAAGTYTAYVYADGHTETNPPGRPKSREDMQRERAAEAAQADAKTAVSTTRASASQSAPLQRENAAAAGSRLVLSPYRNFQHKLGTLVGTAATPQTAGGLRDTLLTTVHTGTPPGADELVLDDDLDRTDTRVVQAPKRGR
jgi:hypothetical protein